MDKDGNTPLLFAIICKRQKMVAFLVKNQANVHTVDRLRQYTLVIIYIREHLRTQVAYRHKRVHVKSYYVYIDRTALMLPVHYGSSGIVSIFLQENINVFTQDA
ncbi:Ankyrin repeat domain-containing protein 20B, partial [Plecturocebus cupreus]